jgi:uncharacterized protein (TIGR02996 family)
MAMTDEDALLQAVRDHVDDDAPRLVYADWLEEHGDAARAEFIRVQCALAQRGLPRSRRERLRTREQEMLQLHRQRWLGSLRRSPLPWVFHRGFVARLGDSGVFWTATALVDRGGRIWFCNRFLPDGVILGGDDSREPSRETAQWLSEHLVKGRRWVSRGHYSLEVRPRHVAVRVEFPWPQGKSEYRGTIQGTVMNLTPLTPPPGLGGRWRYQWLDFAAAGVS